MSDDTKYIDLARQIVLREVSTDEYAVFLFGSRTEKRHSQTSDIDIGILGKRPLPLEVRAHLLELLNDSDIPYHVDVVDFFTADPEFKKHALKKSIVWNLPNCINFD